MSKKARRRPSWKWHQKIPDPLILYLINDKTDRLMKIVRVPNMGYVGRGLMEQFGKEKTEEMLAQFFIKAAKELTDAERQVCDYL